MKSLTHLILLLSLPLAHCEGQNACKTMSQAQNPLLCNTDAGLCEIPGNTTSTATNGDLPLPKPKKTVQILYFTDLICSSCWGIEPQLRRLKLEYGDHFDIEYRMGGLLPSWDVYNSGNISKPSDVAHHWDEVSQHYEMPIDGDVWLEDPLPSSFPPSIAFKAAQMQDEKKSVEFLRQIREMVFLEKKNITKWEHLETAAKQVGLDATRMKADMEGPAARAFEADMELARSLGVRSFPTMIFSDADQQRLVLKGVRPYEQFEQTLQALHPELLKNAYDASAIALFERYPSLTAKEFAVLTNVTKAQAEKTLGQLAEQKTLEVFVTKNGRIWRKAN